MSTSYVSPAPYRIALAMPRDVAGWFFPPAVLDALPPELELLSREPLESFDSPEAEVILGSVDGLLTCWGTPLIDASVLDRAPRLRTIHHAAGTVKPHVARVCWERGLQVTSAADENAIPVAEYTVAMVLLANKKIFQLSGRLHRERTAMDPQALFPGMGNHRKRVGVIGASRIGRHVLRLLEPYSLELCVADPYLSTEEAAALGARLLPLDELVATSDVVTLHAPSLPSTAGMISRALISALKPGATFINTARGELVDQDALAERLAVGDVYAVLDVTTPWVLPEGSPFYELPNVLLTPHIAGSLGTELERLAASALGEASRAARGEALLHEVTLAELDRMA
ncbi:MULTISPECIES: hydroxyacid dehydrogenase [Arthrobacter]|uniref:Hydroxyacid dehydrogenase n=2 Tax=Arthrobacter TaxID=1663 RepID=A0ABU9KPP3_9MICC|nr:hydroxyacid dehydrogenase [Arthrobacter sp. YJM1]MDP5227954.1 hydroxyacid dehydrogenase [Arthrobacter sp. YJM1]